MQSFTPGSEGQSLEARRAELQRAVRHAGQQGRSAHASPRSLETSLELEQIADRLAHVYRIELAPGVTPRDAAAAYAEDAHVEWAQVDEARVLDGGVIDPFRTTSGSWGQPYADLWGFDQIRAEAAWGESRGQGVVVAVVDSGLDWRHPDIAENVFVHPGEDLNGNGRVDDDEWNGVDDDGNGYIDDLVGFDFANSIDANGDGDYDDAEDLNDPDPFDDNGHGTHVAGIIAAVADNGEGIAGVAPDARIMSLKGFKADGSNSDALLWRAVLYAALNGAQVINNSWSCGAPCPRNPLAEDVVRLVHELGVTIVTSAGNRSRDVVSFSPENMWQTITVGSSDVDGGPSLSFTNQGFGMDLLAPGGDPLDTPGVSVPRRNILSLRSSAGDPIEAPYEVGEGYIRLAGTSMAAPQVAGVAALLYAQQPGRTPDEVRRIIRRTAFDLGPPGHDWDTGAGRLDALAALQAMPEPDWIFRVESPRASSWFDPLVDSVVIEGSVLGPDLSGYEVAVGEGVRPAAWEAITSSANPVHDGVLAEWHVDPGVRGAWVIRVTARSTDGRQAYEYIPVSFDSLRAQVLSSPGPQAELPAIHGRRVVWQSRRGTTQDRFGRWDHELFEATFGHGSERTLLVAPGDQFAPAISADRSGVTYSWSSKAEVTDPTRAQGCRTHRGRDGVCRPFDLGGAGGQPQAPVPARDAVYWLEQGPSGPSEVDVAACRFTEPGGRCLPIDTGLEPGRRSFLDGDGRGTLSWNAADDALRIATCEVDSDGRCDEVRLPVGERAYTRPAASRSLVAWVAGRLFGARPLLACVRDADGDCTPIEIIEAAEDARVRVSGDLVVWDGRVGEEASDVFFCEYDRLRDRCPVQRLTSELSRQDSSVVDDRRIVWVDEREGPGRIAGVELPRWRPLGPRRARVGSPMRLVAWLDLAGHDVAAVEFDHDGGLAPADIRIQSRRHGLVPVRVNWCPGAGDVGEQVWTLQAETTSGLTTRRSFTVHVEPAQAGPRWRTRRRCTASAPGLRVAEDTP